MYRGIQHSIRNNFLKSFFLLASFPLLLRTALTIFFFFFLANQSNRVSLHDAIDATNEQFIWLGPVILIWWVISFLFHRQIIFSFSGAKPISRKELPEVYNIVENLCISKWLPTPQIGIMEDSSLNAFALWRNQKNAWIVFSRWLIEKLNKAEIEAVAWHELTHIINKDSLLMVIVVVFIGIIGTLGQILIRMWWRSSNNKKGNIFPLIGFVLLVLWYLFFPLIRLALSRKREFLADAWSVLLTNDTQAMISALQKISTDPRVESIQQDTVAALCIENPLDRSFFSSILSTHPPIEERIRALQSY